MNQFKDGDVVVLNSGGEKMTVAYVVGNGTFDDAYTLQGFENGDVLCQWFENKKLQKQTFKSTMVQKVND